MKSEVSILTYMDKGDSFSSTNIDEEFDDAVYTTPELRFSTILDISFISKARNNIILFSAKIHSSSGISSCLGIIFSIISLIQILLSSLFINSVTLWPKGHILSRIFRVLDVLLDGPSVFHQNQRIVMSLILSFIFLIGLFFIINRSFSYAKEKIISEAEMYCILLFNKYILLLFCPHLLVGFPISCCNLIENGFNIIELLTVILVPIAAISYIIFYFYLMQTRVLLEKTPFHEWLPLLPVREIPISICATLGTCTGFLTANDKDTLIFFPLVNSLFYIASGIYVNFYSNYLKQKYVLFLSSSFFTSTVISIFQVFNFLYGTINPTFILILIVLSFVVFFLITFQIQRKKVFSMLKFCDECLESPDRCHSLMEQEFPTPSSFICKVIPIIDQFHPFLFEWKLFDYALIKWPKNFDILLLYGRLLSIFPNKSKTAMFVVSLITKLESPLSSVYSVQFRQIMQERQKNVSLQLSKKMEDIKTQIYVLKTLIRRFWENVLQKNMTNFWADVDKVAQRIKDLDRTLVQLTEDFPNNVEVFHLYHSFLTELKHSPNEASEISDKINLIKNQGYQKADTAMSLAESIFPDIQPYLQRIQELHDDNENENESNLNKNNKLLNTNSMSCSNSNLYTMSMFDRMDSINTDIRTDQSETDNLTIFKHALQEMMDHTKLGRIWIVLLVCTIMSAIVIAAFVLFSQTYIHDFISRQEKVIEFISEASLMRYRIVYLNLFMSMQSLFLAEKIIINQNMMYSIAPNLYTKCHDIPRWNFSTSVIRSVISAASLELASMMNALDSIENWNNISESIKNTITDSILIDELNFQSAAEKLFDNCDEIIQHSTTYSDYFENVSAKVDPYFKVIHSFFEKVNNLTFEYATNDNDESVEKMTTMIIVVVIIALVLLSIPFTFQVFRLQSEMNAISDSFSFFPNSEIRAAINKFGLSSSKKEDDSAYIAKLTHRPNTLTGNLTLFVTFFATFIPLTVCCIVMHFIAFSFLNESRRTSLQIWSLYKPFTDLVMSLQFSVLVSHADVLGASNLTREEDAKSIGDFVTEAERVFSTINSPSGDDISMRYFDSCFPIDKIPQTKSLFEVLVTDEFAISISLVCSSLKCLSSRLLSSSMSVDEDQELLSLFFYFTDFVEENRISIHFRSVERSARRTVARFRSVQKEITIVAVVCQCLAFVFILLILLSKHNQIRNSLRFFNDLSPVTVSQNQHAVVLISTGRLQDEASRSSFSNAETILCMMPLGVVLIDRQLLVTDVNSAFLRIAKCDDKDISQMPITDIINRAVAVQTNEKNEMNGGEVMLKDFEGNDNRVPIVVNYDERRSWPDFIQHISDALNGRYPTNFSSKVTVNLGNDRSTQYHFICNVICLAADRPALDGEQDLVEKVAIVITDVTEDVRKRKLIEWKQKQLEQMIANVIPSRIINALLRGEENISFVCQSLTVGQICFYHNISFDYKSLEIFDFYNNLSNECDDIISDFNLLCRVRTDGQKYLFAGGLFDPMSKPEKHAEQAIKFALKVIKHFTMKQDVKIAVKIGIETGGPAIAGVISITRPNLQIIGPVIDNAIELAESCEPNEVHIALSVYELVFTSSFNVIEKGDMILNDGNAISTYSVVPEF